MKIFRLFTKNRPCEINFSQNLAKIQVGPKYMLAPPPKFQVGLQPAATPHSSTNVPGQAASDIP